MKRLKAMLLCLILCQSNFAALDFGIDDNEIDSYDQALLINKDEGILCQASIHENKGLAPIGLEVAQSNPFAEIDDCGEEDLSLMVDSADSISLKAETAMVPFFMAAGCVAGSLISAGLNQYFDNDTGLDDAAAGLVGSAVGVGAGTPLIAYGPGVFFVPSASMGGIPAAVAGIAGASAAIPGMICAATTHYIFYAKTPKRPASSKVRRNSRKRRK